MENKIQSFATFSETRKAAMETKLREEANTRRTSEAQRFADLLAEFEVSTVAEIAEILISSSLVIELKRASLC